MVSLVEMMMTADSLRLASVGHTARRGIDFGAGLGYNHS